MTIQELEHWFTTVELPPAPVMLHPSTTITDVNQFLESHFYLLKLGVNECIAQPLLDRLDLNRKSDAFFKGVPRGV